MCSTKECGKSAFQNNTIICGNLSSVASLSFRLLVQVML